MLEDLFPAVWKQGLRRTLDFPYEWYVDDYGHPAAYKPVAPVTAADCDSVYLGSVLTPDLRCPRCGGDPKEAVEEEWAEMCRNCHRPFAEVESSGAYTSIWNKRLKRFDWQCHVCRHQQTRKS